MRASSFTALLLASACATSLQSNQDMSPEDAEELFSARFERTLTRRTGDGIGRYDTLAPVAGAPDVAPLPMADNPTSVLSQDTLDAATQFAGRNNSSALMIWKDGELITEAYFEGFDRDSLLVSRSLAKPLSVVAVGRAVAEGHISTIDDPAADYITEWKGTPKEAIRVRDLLSMHSGLLPQAAAPDKDNILNKAYLHPFHDEIIVNDYPLVAEPGTVYGYSNATGDLLAILIERAAGKSYEDWLTEEVFTPLGAAGGEIWMNRPGGTPHAGCCILLPAETYLRIGILLSQNGEWNGRQLLTPEFVEAMKTPGIDFENAGMGLYLGTPFREWRGASGNTDTPMLSSSWHSEPFLADDLVLFDGNASQAVYIVPSEQLVILRTGNHPPKEPQWDNAYLPNLVLSGLAGRSD